MNDFEKEVLERLTRIDENLKGLNKRIYGNGQPGIEDKLIMLEKKVEVLESKQGWVKESVSLVASLLALSASIYVAFIK